MAAVWLARLQGKHGFEKLVVVKTILPLHADDALFRQMFLDEATIASRIEHSNVAQILDLGEHDGILYLVMEWVDGDSVSSLERDAQQAGPGVPPGIALRIISDCCAGLHAAHELCDARGHSLAVVHRDVSPQNVHVTGKGLVKLIDFGIAKARDRAAEETHAGVFKGKLNYMAPEQALGKALDRRADIWGLAAVLYRLLARRPVYDAGNRFDTLRELTTNARRPPLPPHVPQRIAAIVYQALSFEPADRQSTCAELQSELDRAIGAESLQVSSSELGAFVTRYLGDRLEARRQQISVSLQLLAQGDAAAVAVLPKTANIVPDELHRLPAVGPEVRSAVTRTWAPSIREGSLTTNSTSVSDELAVPSPRHVWRTAAFAALTVGAALLVFWLRAARTDEARTGAASAQVSVHPVAAPLLSAPSAAPEASVVATPPPAPPKSVQHAASLEALPSNPEPKAAVTTPSKLHAASTSSHPKPKRKIIDDGF